MFLSLKIFLASSTTGSKESVPSPKWLTTITLPPLFKIKFMVSALASIREVSKTLTSFGFAPNLSRGSFQSTLTITMVPSIISASSIDFISGLLKIYRFQNLPKLLRLKRSVANQKTGHIAIIYHRLGIWSFYCRAIKHLKRVAHIAPKNLARNFFDKENGFMRISRTHRFPIRLSYGPNRFVGN